MLIAVIVLTADLKASPGRGPVVFPHITLAQLVPAGHQAWLQLHRPHQAGLRLHILGFLKKKFYGDFRGAFFQFLLVNAMVTTLEEKLTWLLNSPVTLSNFPFR